MEGIKIIYYPNSSKKVDLNFLENLHFFLKENPQSILREIKKEFLEVVNLDEKLDYFIAENWIIRKDKRYETSLKEFSKEKYKKLLEKQKDFLQELKNLGLNGVEAFEGMTVTKSIQPIVITTENYHKVRNFLFSKKQLISEKFTVTVYENEVPQTSVTNYFFGKKETPELNEIYDLLGDVTVDYYLDQTLGKLFRSKDKSLNESRKDIFTESLFLFQLLDAEKKAKVLFQEDLSVDIEKVAALQVVFEKAVGEELPFYQELFKGHVLLDFYSKGKVNFHEGLLTIIEKNKKKRR